MDLAKVLVAPVIGGLVFAIGAQAIAPNRTEVSMRATPFADFVPEGTVLAYDHFIPGRARGPFFVSQTDRAQIDRILATDDPAAFQAAFIARARAVGAELVYGKANVKPPPLSQIRTWENAPDLGAYAQGTLAEFTFSSRAPMIVGGRSLKWRIAFHVTDGPCHFLFLECEPAVDT